jgi:hypothetical protein
MYKRLRISLREIFVLQSCLYYPSLLMFSWQPGEAIRYSLARQNSSHRLPPEYKNSLRSPFPQPPYIELWHPANGATQQFKIFDEGVLPGPVDKPVCMRERVDNAQPREYLSACCPSLSYFSRLGRLLSPSRRPPSKNVYLSVSFLPR